MKYLDPLPVECPHCRETREYSVEDLRNFRAICPVCNYDLTSVGKKMRETEAYWAYVMLDLVDFILKLESKLPIQYEDKEVENLKTLDEVFRLTLTKLPANFNANELKQIIFETASEAGNYSVSQLNWEMNLREVLERVE